MKFEGRLPDEGINVSPEHPLRELALLIGGLFALAGCFIVGAALAVDSLVPMIPPQVEARIFSSTWLTALDDEEADVDPRTAELQSLLDRLAVHWEDRPYRFEVGLLDDEQPNAMAFPGGTILVTTGLLEQVESENELALVLGHELGHYRGRDHLRGLGRGLATAFVFAAIGATGADAVAGAAGLAGQLTQRGFGREQERNADAFGLLLVHAEYGHVAGTFDFFGRLPSPDGAVEKKLASYLSTHPLHDDRIEALRSEARARGWSLEGALAPLALSQDGS